MQKFQRTWLWQSAFANNTQGYDSHELEFFRQQFLSMRANVAILVSRIAADLPGLTLHDISHLDALWETVSLVANPHQPLTAIPHKRCEYFPHKFC